MKVKPKFSCLKISVFKHRSTFGANYTKNTSETVRSVTFSLKRFKPLTKSFLISWNEEKRLQNWFLIFNPYVPNAPFLYPLKNIFAKYFGAAVFQNSERCFPPYLTVNTSCYLLCGLLFKYYLVIMIFR